MHIWFRNRSLRAFVAWSTCLSLGLSSSAIAGDGPFRLIDWQPDGNAVEQLAERIDHMERNLDEYGSVVIKTPDVWGESRLMRHRSDVENQLKARLNGFDFRINAVQSTRDAAFLATAIALQEQLATNDVNPLTGTAITANAQAPNPTNVNQATAPLIDNSTGIVPRSGFSGNLAAFSGTPTAVPIRVGIEPVIELDQLNRYLQHLNELRRLNEGDDNSDMPGYALNLIRIPVSVLPGRKTEEGFGAEVQITIDPYISDEILPLAFKDFVINGVVDRISFDVFQIAQGADICALESHVEPKRIGNPAAITGSPNASNQGNRISPNSGGSDPQSTNVDEAAPISNFRDVLRNAETWKLQTFHQSLVDGSDVASAAEAADLDVKDAQNVSAKFAKDEVRLVIDSRLLADINHSSTSLPASHRQRVNSESLLVLALHTYRSLVHSGFSAAECSPVNVVPPDHRVEHGLTMPEVETLLRTEAEAAYEFLSQPSAAYLWTQFCTPELASRIREHQKNIVSGDRADVEQLNFFDQVKITHSGVHNSVTAALAWQIIVESALQNEQLVKDMRETATLKNCPCIAQDWMPFFGPNPCPEARIAFREYVKCKWPIHVFALDPVTQDQNIADSFSQRREFQMSIAIAAANQGLGGQALSRFVRRMEYDLETIELNRTAVAFSHGDNTFGWRFYPRVQAPPVPSNLRATFGDLLIGGQDRDDLLRTRKLEPGIRECTALVVMPSFVPQVMVDVRSNWFRLAKHTPLKPFMRRKPGYETSMELSRELTDLKRLSAQCINDAHLYRDGEVYRLCKAVERLDDRLPLQTHNVPVPWENDLGGFEVFQSGTPVLGPEIHGWYGAPGVIVRDQTPSRNAAVLLVEKQQELNNRNLDFALAKNRFPNDTALLGAITADITVIQTKVTELQTLLRNATLATTDTAIFLVGKNFSVLNCRVIAGGVDVTNTIEVINRNLMQVRIPSTVSTVTTDHSPGDDRNVVVHLATPYGATSRLIIPVAEDKKADEVAEAVKKAEASAKAAADSASKVTDRHPVILEWDVAKKDVKASWRGRGHATLSDVTHNQTLKVVDKRAAFDFDNEQSSSLEGGVLLLWITCGDVKQGVNLGLLDGSCPKFDDGGMERCLTMEDLLGIVMGSIGELLPPTPSKPAKVTVRGGMKFNNGQPVIGFDDKIVFNLIPDATQAQP